MTNASDECELMNHEQMIDLTEQGGVIVQIISEHLFCVKPPRGGLMRAIENIGRVSYNLPTGSTQMNDYNLI